MKNWTDQELKEFAKSILSWIDPDKEFEKWKQSKEIYPEGINSVRNKQSSFVESITEKHYLYDYWCKAHLKNKDWEIHSVKTPNGEIFTVGDEVSNGGKGTIVYFKIIEGKIETKIAYNTGYSYWVIQLLVKSSPILFTTKDGVPVYSGTHFWHVDNNFKISENHGFEGISNKILGFSTKEKAEEYIKLNKPKFSEKQVLDAVLYAVSKNAVICQDWLNNFKEKLGIK